MPVVQEDVLTSFSQSLLIAAGAGAAEAQIVATSLVGANLRGHDSHGVMRIPFYIGRVKEGILNPESHLKIVSQSTASMVGDGGWGFGQVIARELMERLMPTAAENGIAIGTLRQSAHIGRLGEYAEMAVEKGMASIICANTHGAAQRVAPLGGKRPRLGTNPLCMGFPGDAGKPFILDFSTSATAEGKVRVKRIAGEEVPAGWILDPDGNPTTDPNQLYGDPPGTILPMGGDQGYKGFGLSLLIEMLCGALSGGQCAHPDPPPPIGNCAMFIVIAPERLAGNDHLHREVSALEKYVRGVPRIDESQPITLPGDPERRVLTERTANGIPIDEKNWEALTTLANELGITAPNV